jgi:hypothetical protein
MDQDEFLDYLRQKLQMCWASGDDAYPDRIIQNFRESCRDPIFMKYYGIADEATLVAVIQERYPDYEGEPTPVPTPQVEDLGPRVKVLNKETEVKTPTWTPTTAQWSWVDDELEELDKECPEPKKKRTVKYDSRNDKKDLAKVLIVNFLNADRNTRRKGFKISMIYRRVDWVHQLAERTMRTYLTELYKEGKVKMWREKVTLDTGQIVYHHWYTSVANSDAKYTMWIQK